MDIKSQELTSAYAKVTKAQGGKAEALATDEHGKTRKEGTSFRAGCVSDGWAPSLPQ